jgi:4-amino-4-deoxy-L-arabinose transferase-like glycosyltransferase
MTPPPAWLPRERAALAALVLLSLLLRTLGLGDQPLTGDDGLVGMTAINFSQSGWPEPTMWNHPRLRDLLVAASLAIAGFGPWGIRFWSVLFGTGAVLAIGLLVRSVTGHRRAGLLAALLVAVDPLHVDFSRQGINDVYLSFFPLAALLLVWRYRSSRAPALLAAAGLLVGFGLASKWSVAFPVAAAALLLLSDAWRLPTARERLAELGLVSVCFALLPVALYAATYLPWFARGHSLAEWLDFQRATAIETATHTGYGNKLPGYLGEVVGAWNWFMRPIYYVDLVPSPAPGQRPGFQVGLSNPFTWMAVWPSLGLLAFRVRRDRDVGAALVSALFLCSYLPFALVSRPIWTNSSVAVVPVALAVVAVAAASLSERWPRLVAAWLAVALLFAAAAWLPAIGRPSGPGDFLLSRLVPPEAYLRQGVPDPGRSSSPPPSSLQEK